MIVCVLNKNKRTQKNISNSIYIYWLAVSVSVSLIKACAQQRNNNFDCNAFLRESQFTKLLTKYCGISLTVAVGCCCWCFTTISVAFRAKPSWFDDVLANIYCTIFRLECIYSMHCMCNKLMATFTKTTTAAPKCTVMITFWWVVANAYHMN